MAGRTASARLEAGARRAALASAVAGGSVVVGGALGSVGAAAYFARKALTPDRQRPDDTQILAVRGDTVTLDLTENTAMPGRYGLWLDGGRGHVRLGEPVEVDTEIGRVRRVVHGVDYGHLAPGYARWNQYYYAGPPDRALGVTTRYLDVDTELGTMPAWVVEADGGSDRWAVLVHGRGARRDEALRAVRPMLDAGLSVLVPSYRNDVGARSGADGRYNLGLSEWRDVEDAAALAVRSGARELVLVGWSMGGAIVLQTLSRSMLADQVTHVVLDAPVIDWGDVLAHHARIHRVPAPIGALSRSLMGRRATRRLVGVHSPLDVAKTNWVERADELRHRMLLVHSVDDEFVPCGPSQRLAAARPDLVTMEHWDTARHTKEWNLDPDRWERSVTEFVSG